MTASAVRIIDLKRIPQRQDLQTPKDNAVAFDDIPGRSVDTILTVTRSDRCAFIPFPSHPLLRKILSPNELHGFEPRKLRFFFLARPSERTRVLIQVYFV